jgi:ABC-2 type transport system ATP-binding protein
MENIIEIEGLTKKYGDYTAVNNLKLNIGKGEVFGLLGPNGAGKSTTILMLLGLTEPDGGKARVCGLDPVQAPIQVKKKVGYLPEDVGFYDDLTGFENLVYSAQLNNFSRSEAEQKANQLIERVDLTKHKDKKAGKYSRGMRQRLGLADVLIKNPEVVILDEPTLGIDPTGVKEFLKLITGLSRQEGITVLFSSHHLYQVQQVCDRVGIFVEGKLLACGNIASLARQLFSNETFIVEGQLADRTNSKPTKVALPDLIKNLNGMAGITGIKIDDNKFEIRSETNVASAVSETVVEAGYGLNYLTNKEYGLDDIYSRYFQQ